MGRGFHMMMNNCKECAARFWSYPNVRGTEGKHPKFCSRKCYAASIAKGKAMRDHQKNSGIVIRVPAKFFDDHEERECEPFCSPFKRTSRFVWLYWNDNGLDELLDDARHYSDEDGGPDSYEGSAAMRKSAAATVSAIENARSSMKTNRELNSGKQSCKANAAPFRVSAQWIMYAHQPAAEDGQKSATELCDMITEKDYVLIPANRIDLVREIIDVAELYSTSYGGDREDRMRAANACRLIKRASQWINDTSAKNEGA